MGLSWNEIKSRALLFSNNWGDAVEPAAQCVLNAAYQPSGGKKTYASDAERVAFLFALSADNQFVACSSSQENAQT